MLIDGQRGLARPADSDANGSIRWDIGAAGFQVGEGLYQVYLLLIEG